MEREVRAASTRKKRFCSLAEIDRDFTPPPVHAVGVAVSFVGSFSRIAPYPRRSSSPRLGSSRSLQPKHIPASVSVAIFARMYRRSCRKSDGMAGDICGNGRVVTCPGSCGVERSRTAVAGDTVLVAAVSSPALVAGTHGRGHIETERENELRETCPKVFAPPTRVGSHGSVAETGATCSGTVQPPRNAALSPPRTYLARDCLPARLWRRECTVCVRDVWGFIDIH